jgi:cytidylate kinase
MPRSIPVLAIDGPSGSGKGTLAQMLARHLNWHLLDSGALYRIVGLAAIEKGVDLDDEPALAAIAKQLKIEFAPSQLGQPAAVLLDGRDVSSAVRGIVGETARLCAQARFGCRWPRYGHRGVH